MQQILLDILTKLDFFVDFACPVFLVVFKNEIYTLTKKKRFFVISSIIRKEITDRVS